MRQPDLGSKVTELRLAMNLTQEQLAEYCEVSTRTIQRIESGEVDPRTHTLAMLGDTLEFDFGQDDTQNENLWLALLHVSSMFLVLIVPLLIWSWKKPQSRKIDEQGRQALNFQITMTLVLFSWVFLLLLILTIGAVAGESGMTTAVNDSLVAGVVLFASFLPILIGGFCTYQGIANAARALSDNPVHYALSIHFIK